MNTTIKPIRRPFIVSETDGSKSFGMARRLFSGHFNDCSYKQFRCGGKSDPTKEQSVAVCEPLNRGTFKQILGQESNASPFFTPHQIVQMVESYRNEMIRDGGYGNFFGFIRGNRKLIARVDISCSHHLVIQFYDFFDKTIWWKNGPLFIVPASFTKPYSWLPIHPFHSH
jgi:hypothetical protein